MSKRYLSLSVHQLVDFLLRKGDIDDRVYNTETRNEGSRLHSAYQSKQGSDYVSEMYLSQRIEVEEGVITLSGRADGIILGGECPIIDEIKTTNASVKDFSEQEHDWHLGQAACYAYMYLCIQGGEKAKVRLTYFHQINTEDTLTWEQEYRREELQEMVEGFCRDYLAFCKPLFEHQSRRDEAAKALSFPYPSFRKGQRECSKLVYGLCQKGGSLFIEAPTGIGKTMSTLFPAVKSLKSGRVDKIFYWTAKNTGAAAAMAALVELRGEGDDFYGVELRAKEKTCFCPEASCNPDECPFAKGYYGKLRAAIADALSSKQAFTPEFIRDHCLKHELCPFEFQLDLSNSCDVVIGDYNYFFDPLVHLERYFDEAVDSSTYVCLVDEAHNLLDRGRDMYSASLARSACLQAKKSLKGDAHKSLRNALTKILKAMDALLEEDGVLDLACPSTDFIKTLGNLKAAYQRASKKAVVPTSESYRHFSRDANRFCRLFEEHFDGTYRTYVRRYHDEVEIKMLCIDPAPKLNQSAHKVKGCAFFSATLSPIDYYMDAILGETNHPYLLLSSPFPKENLDLMIAPKVSVRYKDRENSYGEVAEYLQKFVEGKIGNYFLFFPSYEYMEHILPILDFGEAEVLMQQRTMTPKERGDFLAAFAPNPDHTRVGLLILGGAFAEGVDLVDDRLIGVAIVGIGIPQIGKENNLIRAYHDEKSGQGYEYAYLDPGMNKVLQGLGRLIRGESDRGAALLIDDRYMKEEYRSLFQRLYHVYDVVLSPREVQENLALFYGGKR